MHGSSANLDPVCPIQTEFENGTKFLHLVGCVQTMPVTKNVKPTCKPYELEGGIAYLMGLKP